MLKIKNIIPTDRSYFIMRIIGEKPGIKKDKLRKRYKEYLKEAVYYQLTGFHKRAIHKNFSKRAAMALNYYLPKLEEKGLITNDDEGFSLTDIGYRIIEATDEIFFQGRPPQDIAYLTVKERKLKYERKEYTPMGILYITFHGGECQDLPDRLLQIEKLQQPVKDMEGKWVPYLGRRGDEKQGIIMDSTSLLKLIRQGFLEVSTDIKKRNKGMRDYRLFEDSISNISKEIIDLLEYRKKGDYTEEQKEKLRYKLIFFGLKKETALWLDSPLEAKVLWYLSRGYHLKTKIAKETGAHPVTVKNTIKKLEYKGLIYHDSIYIRINKNRERTKRIMSYFRTLEDILAEQS